MSKDVVGCPVADHGVQDDQGLECDLCDPVRRGTGEQDSVRTMAFGSRRRGTRALQTSWTAPSSDQVAAMMGSRYWGGALWAGRERQRGGAPLPLGGRALACRPT